ncbi:MAG: stage III sporulation protein AE [Clostridiales bacterium]|jgi:stage III sporulation protein AE|nr:stage III sporulation protein AE [Clostridiales bacterium]
MTGAPDIFSGQLDRQLDLIDFSGIDRLNAGSGGARGLLSEILSGKFSLSPEGFINAGARLFFGEISDNLGLFKKILLAVILSAVIKALSGAQKNKSVAEMAFFASYASVLTMLFSSFTTVIKISGGVIDALTEFMNAAAPVVCAVAAMTDVYAAGRLSPVLSILSAVLAGVIKNFVIGGASMALCVQTVNFLSEKEILTKFGEFCKNGLTLLLKLTVSAFCAVLSLQRLTAPPLSGAGGFAVKNAVKFVPVVGGALSSSVDTYFYAAKTLKNGAVAAVVIAAGYILAVPVVKTAVLIAMYKAAAVIAQPICDERVVKCMDAAGDFAALLLGGLFAVIIMFLFTLIIVVSL